METITRITREMVYKAIVEGEGIDTLVIARDGRTFDRMHPDELKQKDVDSYCIICTPVSIGFRPEFLRRPRTLHRFSEHAANLLNQGLMQKNNEYPGAIYYPTSNAFIAPKLGVIWWLAPDGVELSPRDLVLINGVLKHDYPEDIALGTALGSRTLRRFNHNGHSAHLAGEIDRINADGGVIFVAECMRLPDALLVEDLYLIRRADIFRMKDRKMVKVWPC